MLPRTLESLCAPLLVRPVYDSADWTPAAVDFAILTITGLLAEVLKPIGTARNTGVLRSG